MLSKIPFTYHRYWYENEILEWVHDTDDLEGWYCSQPNPVKGWLNHSGRLLIIGLDRGVEAYYLSQQNPDLEIWAVDWNRNLEKALDAIVEIIPNLKKVSLIDVEGLVVPEKYFNYVLVSQNLLSKMPEKKRDRVLKLVEQWGERVFVGKGTLVPKV